MVSYSDNPSMDEILKRIKKALAEREARVEEEARTLGISEQEEEPAVYPVSLHEVKEISERSENSDEIVQNVIKNEIFIKPNLSAGDHDDVFVLRKDMEVSDAKLFDNVDFSKFVSLISKNMSKDLAIAFMSPKIESWLLNNFWEFVEKSKK